jgi:hypothetical protein
VPRSNRPRRGGRPVRGRRPASDAAEDRDEDVDGGRALRGFRRVEDRPDGSWMVTRVNGQQTVKTYRCPGCNQEIRPGTAHVVVWSAEPLGALGGLEDRRHWHTPCWAAGARGRR